MILRSPCPALTLISWLLKSMKRRPSTVVKCTPLALATAIGFSPDWSAQAGPGTLADGAAERPAATALAGPPASHYLHSPRRALPPALPPAAPRRDVQT